MDGKYVPHRKIVDGATPSHKVWRLNERQSTYRSGKENKLKTVSYSLGIRGTPKLSGLLPELRI